MLALGALLFLADQQAILATGNLNLLPSLLLFGALVVPVTFVVWMNGREPEHDVPGAVLLLCGLVGGALGTAAASVLEANSAARLGGLPVPLVGLIEESAKLALPLVILFLGRYNAKSGNGLLIGAAVGTGFAVLETLGYGFVTLLATGGDLFATEGLLMLRGVLSPAAHIAWTGLASAALWQAWAQPWRASAIASAVGTFVFVVVLHTLWDLFPGWPTFLVVGGCSLVLLVRRVHHDVLGTGHRLRR
jgi:RsiW-degrading membrane proteinase PrsW (M82 family)